MNKERFMQIAEEVGIASSDWKEDLWRAHQVGLSAVRDYNSNYSPDEKIVRLGLIISKAISRDACRAVLEKVELISDDEE